MLIERRQLYFQYLNLGMVCAFCVLMSLASNIWAQQAASAELQCDQTTIENHQDGCKTHKQHKRKQLTTKKISPEIRTEALRRDREFDINKLHPFLVGSGITN